MVVCCRCNGKSSCKGCACVKAKKCCTNCLPFRQGHCLNSHLSPSPGSDGSLAQAPVTTSTYTSNSTSTSTSTSTGVTSVQASTTTLSQTISTSPGTLNIAHSTTSPSSTPYNAHQSMSTSSSHPTISAWLFTSLCTFFYLGYCKWP